MTRALIALLGVTSAECLTLQKNLAKDRDARTLGTFFLFTIIFFTLEWIFDIVLALLQLQTAICKQLDASCSFLTILLLMLLCLRGFFSFCSIHCIQGQVNKWLYGAEVLDMFFLFVYLNISFHKHIFNCTV